MKNSFLILFFLVLEETECFKGVFWHVCDVHLNLSYKSFGRVQNYGDYKSDSPFSLVKSAFQQMKKIYPNPDFIILNGDNVLHRTVSQPDFNKSLTDVSNELFQNFPSSIILPSLGNHDVNPANFFNPKSQWCRILLEKWLRFFSNNGSEILTFTKGCYYSRRITVNNITVNVIILNTMVWYSFNSHKFTTQNSDDPLNQFSWLKKELEKSRDSATKVFLIGHIPPGASEFNPTIYRHLRPEFNVKFLQIMQEFTDIIDAGFFAHQHTDSFKIVYSLDDKPAIPLFISPSISPFHLAGLGSVNPSVRLYHWRTNPNDRKYDQYHAKLNDVQTNTLSWSLEYSSDSLIPGLSAFHLNELISDFTKEDSKQFDKFFSYHLSGRPHEQNDCSENISCRCNIICGVQNIDYTKLDLCLKNCPHKPVSQWVMIVSVIIIFTIILIGVVIGANKVYCRGRRTASLTRDIYLAPYNGKNCEDIMSEHIDNIAINTFCDVPEYRGHIRNNSRTILTLNDGNEIVEKSQPSFSKFAVQSKNNKSQEKYDYTRM